ncbi:unnamed protein product [Microthlaspi erraticum]|uniref:CCHC-type domain-containing protein n=1 Tax=Microthlaspi erraticum TaxID=1685480 RepID=A0A6D2JPW1_9BRAS|nr:unnamed protein product [Microthlaspi erraticum]CAA7042209.1 unnamed protein product [Microthlaspi erraticum]
MADPAAVVVARTRTRRTIDPYDLSSGDNPESVISQPLLRGPNYDDWATSLRLALKARKKFGFVDGTIPEPAADNEDNEDWWANNAMVISWIKLTIDENLRSSLTTYEKAHDLWNHIKCRFAVRNGQRVQRLKTELANCHQKGLAMQEYYGKLTQLWRSLADYQQAKTMEELAKEREEDKLHQFLMGLDETVYGAVKSSLLSRDPLPSLDEAYQVLAQDEEAKVTSRLLTTRTEEMSFAIQTSNAKQTFSNSNRGGTTCLVCTYCGKTGHSADVCFRKMGYPEWYGDRGRGKSAPPAVGRGRSIPPAVRPAAANVIVSTPPAAAHAAITGADRIGISGLTDTQWQTLVNILNEREQSAGPTLTGKISVSSWIIDTGASNHMTGSVHALDTVCDMSPVPIKLPDGRFTISTKKGTVQLGSELSLQNVYFVEGLKCHLISVSQLTRDQTCVFQITDKLCIIQDRIMKTLIGAGEERSGLYFFRAMDVAAAMHISTKASADI